LLDGVGFGLDGVVWCDLVCEVECWVFDDVMMIWWCKDCDLIKLFVDYN